MRTWGRQAVENQVVREVKHTLVELVLTSIANVYSRRIKALI